MGLFGKSKSKTPSIPANAKPSDPKWGRNKRGKFNKLSLFEPYDEGLRGLSGVYVIWHSGVRPRWVYVDTASDLAGAIEGVQDSADVMEFEKHGGLYVTWANVRDEYQPGVLRYLTEKMEPEIDNPDAKGIRADPVPVIVPGETG